MAEAQERSIGDSGWSEGMMTIDKSTRCPLCGEGRLFFRSHEVSHWSCGTFGPDDAGEYETGTECDKNVFRNGFLRCRALVEKVAALQFIATDKYPDALLCVVPKALLDELRKECEQ